MNSKAAGTFEMSTIMTETSRLLQAILSDSGEWESGFSREITPDTLLAGDLGLSSMDIVQLIVAIEEEFHMRNVPFHELLMESNGQYVNDLTVSQLVNFLFVQLNVKRTIHDAEEGGPR